MELSLYRTNEKLYFQIVLNIKELRKGFGLIENFNI